MNSQSHLAKYPSSLCLLGINLAKYILSPPPLSPLNSKPFSRVSDPVSNCCMLYLEYRIFFSPAPAPIHLHHPVSQPAMAFSSLFPWRSSCTNLDWSISPSPMFSRHHRRSLPGGGDYANSPERPYRPVSREQAVNWESVPLRFLRFWRRSESGAA